ncbi:MAG: hypothetical protein AAGH76_18155 [Pseudomonadota bacterium]
MDTDKAKLVESPTDAFLAHWISYIDDSELLDWAESYARQNSDIDPESKLFQLLWLNRNTVSENAQLGQLIESYALEFDPTFDVKSPSAESVARRFFESRLREYVSERCRPWDVCRMISPIEQLFDFPDWLGDMFNLCDWIEPGTMPVDCRHLEHGIREHLDQASE